MLSKLRSRLRSDYGRALGLSAHLRASLAPVSANVDWSRAKRLVFVCKGNICRSAFAEALARSIGLDATSAGLEARAGDPAEPGIREAAAARGIDLSAHSARRLDSLELRPTDMLVCFEPGQLEAAASLATAAGAQATLLGWYSQPRRPHLEDPYGLSPEYAATCLSIIDSGVRAIARARTGVLVVQSETVAAVAVIRSLGRAGYRVHAGAREKSALGLGSHFAHARVRMPAYDAPEFVEWLRTYVREHAISLIVPSESLLLALRDSFAEFAPLMAYGADSRRVYAGMSKFDLFSSLAGQANLPPCELVDLDAAVDWTALERRLERLPAPLYLKLDAAYSRSGGGGIVRRAANAAEAVAEARELSRSYRRLLVQGHVSGRGVGACFLLDRGEVRAEFLHLRLHEVPHTGGASSLRTSFHHAAIRADALAKLAAIDWQGPAMMEYRWDPATDEFRLMELNGRFWGSLHLPIAAGIDFPRLLADRRFGISDELATIYKDGVLCRHTFPAEVQHVWSLLKDPSVSPARKARSLAQFGLLGLDPRVTSDLSFPGDRGLYLTAAWAFASTTLSALARRAAKK